MHDPTYPHQDEHSHEHDHKAGKTKDALVLSYMLEHNRQHTAELIELADKIDHTADTDTAALIRDAAKDYAAGNAKLQTALRNL